ncbi:MAG: hypothetical protein RL341_1244 [Pseudomonadota bacterium]|jgi:hypothetical protein
MGIACFSFAFVIHRSKRGARTLNSPLKRQDRQVPSGAVGQKLFERSEFFCPPLGA